MGRELALELLARGASVAGKLKPYPADRAARDILDGMERDRYRVLVGPDAKLLDVLYRLHPRRAAAFIAAQMKELLPS
jgi:hypothetical protein